MKINDLILTGFSKSQIKRIHREFKDDDMSEWDICQRIVDVTGYSVGMLYAPGEPRELIRMEKEV